jgi:4-oxalocrotonate tautomerase
MPLVTIKIIEGRTVEQKRELAKDVTEAIVKNIGCPTDAVHIDFVNLKPEDVSQGGKLFADGR